MKLIGIILAVIIGVYSACTHKQGGSTDEVGFIDPDQRALPKDGSIAISHETSAGAVTDTTLDGKGEVIAPASESSQSIESSDAVKEQTTNEPSSKNIESPENASPSSETISNKDAEKSPAKQKIGTGRLVRYIKAKDLNIRSQPNRFSKIIGMLNGGDKVHVTIIGGWAKLDEGQWIRARWLSRSPPTVILGGEVGGEIEDRTSEGDEINKEESYPRKKLKSHKQKRN